MMRLNLPGAVSLNVLADLVSERLGIQIIYDEELRKETVVVKAPNQMPESSLLPLLESVLRIKGFAVVDAEVQGWKRIVKSDDLAVIARPVAERGLAARSPSEVVTQAFMLQFTKAARLDELIKPFLTDPGANTILLDEQNTLIVTDYASNLRRIASLAETIDVQGPKPVLEFFRVQHIEAGALTTQLTQVLASRHSGDAAPQAGVTLSITADARTNQLLMTGTQEQIDEAKQLATALDVSLDLRSQVYAFQYVKASRIDGLVQDLLDPLTVERLYRSSVDDNDNLLIVSTTPEIHTRIEELRRQVDVEAQRAGKEVEFYRLKYAKALEVLQTVRSIQQGALPTQDFSARGVSPLGRGRFNGGQYAPSQGVQGQFAPGPNSPMVPGASELPQPPAFVPPLEGIQGTGQPQLNTPGSGSPTAIVPELQGTRADVTADESTNSLIVVADRPTQERYRKLIEFLDRRRPQVMIEAKVVILDTTNSYSVGVEFSGGDRTGVNRLFNFSSFGLSTVDPTNGALSLAPGLGYNFALVEPDVADAVLRALATHTKARVVSAPRVLVNDNATGTLASVSEVPFTSVNASDTVATTSFAGFAEAGTTIQATPRISDDHELQLEFVVTLNSFTGTGSAGVPPPRQTNEVASTVTIPDGYTVIVGGLNQKNEAFDQDAIPFIEKIPLLRSVTSSTTQSNSQNTLFVFLRPVILRDDKFEDLKYLSDRDLRPSELRPNFPTSQPLLIR